MPETAADFDFHAYDYVVDAIDTVTGKIQLIVQADSACNAGDQLYGGGEQDGSDSVQGGGHLPDECMPAGKGDAP